MNIEENIPKWQQAAKALLPNLPDEIKVEFDNQYLIPETGVGGFAATKDKIVLAFDRDRGDEQTQLKLLRASYLHECYHLAQGWVGDVKQSPLDEAILEGAATVFERDRAGTNPPWSEYPASAVTEQWLKEVKELPADYDKNKWKYYDETSGEQWILYRLGTYLVDQALAKNRQLKIEDLATMMPSEILKLKER